MWAKNKALLTTTLFIGFLILGANTVLYAQKFDRVEAYAGLNLLQENNGCALADFDADGDLDLFVVAKAQDQSTSEKTQSKLFRNNNDGTFTDVTANSGLVNLFPTTEETEYTDALNGHKYGAFWGDYDNDSFPDLFLTNTFKIQLFHNEKNGTFKDVTIQAGFSKFNRNINTGATWFDYNNDGFLDIYMSDWGSDYDGNRLFRNNQNGTFTNVTSIISGVTKNKHSYQSIPFDFNGDGWMDLYVANDYSDETNDLYINNQGNGFTESAASYGLDYAKDDMGIAIGDYNGDGAFDFYVTAIGDNQLFENQGNNTYVNLGRSLGVYNTGWAWDARFADFDLDRDEDLLVLNGFEFGSSGKYVNTYYKNQLENFKSTLVNSSETVGLGEATISVSEAVFDFDNDGDLDVYVTNNDGPSYLYENKITDFVQPAENLNWFKIKLQGTTSNRNAIGTKVFIKTATGFLTRFYTGKGFLGQHLKPVHFGLGTDNEILELTITWPSGLIETHKNIAANNTILAIEGSGFRMLDIEPSVKPYGCTDENSCNYNPFAITSTGKCNYLKTKKITGTVKAFYGSVESYSYPFSENELLTWQVTGGEILEEQNNGSIIVKWGRGSTGKVSVVVKNSKCISKSVDLTVKLSEYDVDFREQSVARLWNEVLLELIRKDYARPTVHARNLFHTSVAMYDAWAVYNDDASPYILGQNVGAFQSDFEGFTTEETKAKAEKQTISYAAYTLLSHRFKHAPNPALAQNILDEIMAALGYDISITTTDYSTGNPAALGNYIASQIIAFGMQDGSNEANQFQNTYYQPVNEALSLSYPEAIENINPNRWQPLSFNNFIDQSGNVIGGVTPDFLGPEWGNVQPFSLSEDDKTTFNRSGHNYQVYHNPGEPPYNDSNDYKWGFSLVSKWSAQLNPDDGVLWHISPKSMGNINSNDFPESFNNYPSFYNEIEGGDIGKGHDINPVTLLPYQEQVVPRGDYTRVLAEFWADGPDSETPPGHWFTILNYVNDHELLQKRFEGEGDILSDLEWDVKSYFILGGAMHDAAVAAWGVKGWYDYIRPISAIRYMCEMGQCTDTSLPNYSTSGIHLQHGLVEVVGENDALAGVNNEHVGKIKLYAWRGHNFIDNPEEDVAGVGWILAENWWPYQRPTFVTPPFAGYVSGHSTFSRAAAEVLTLLTGSAYFPGGMGEFVAKKDDFLVFEKGPSVDVKLQWATYRDASDQCSLSRIWGGIHPPADDIPGRKIGEKVGIEAFNFARQYFSKSEYIQEKLSTKRIVYPNPLLASNKLFVSDTNANDEFKIFDLNGRLLQIPVKTYSESNRITELNFSKTLSAGIYILKTNNQTDKIVVIEK